MGFSVSIDTGGTFTGGYLTDGDTSVWVKVDTTPHDLAQGVLACIDGLGTRLGRSRGELLRRTDRVRLSTTIGTNTLIDRSGPRVGLLLGEGIGHVAGELAPTLPLDASVIATIPDSGEEADARAVLAAMHTLLERGARIVVLALAGGPGLARRELAVRGLIATDYPRHYLGAVPILPSHQVTYAPEPAIRVQSAVLDAYLHPVMSRFLYRVEDELRSSGFPHPMLVANADGGTSRVAKTTALRTWGSGPAGGVAAVAEMVRRIGIERAVGVDIGGTSADISVVQATGWAYTVRPTIEGVTVSLPVLGVESVGQGGGSIARVRDGVLSVGPDSAGAYPGPAAFALGGDRATVTDAAATLGLFDAAGFLGGRKRLDLEAARAAVLRDVATPLGVDVWEAARRILATTAISIARHVEAHLGRRGLRPDAAALFATGGAGGLLADAIGRALGAGERYAFQLSPVFSAFGLSGLPVAHAYDLPADGPSEADSLGELAARAHRDMRSEGVTTSDLEFSLEVEVDGDAVERTPLGRAEPESLAKAERALVGRDGRLARLRAVAPALSPTPDASARRPGASEPAAIADPTSRSTRAVAWKDAPETTPVFDWSTLAPGTSIVGPALIESSETTVAVPPGSIGRAGDHGEVRFDDAA